MSEERERLAELLEEEQESGRWASYPDADLYGFMADAILAAGYRKPRTITTAEELDALPDGSAVLDSSGDVFTKHAHWWHSYETAPLLSRKVVKYGPLTAIHTPGPSA